MRNEYNMRLGMWIEHSKPTLLSFAGVVLAASLSGTPLLLATDAANGRDPNARALRTPPLTMADVAPNVPSPLEHPYRIPYFSTPEGYAAMERARLGFARPTTKLPLIRRVVSPAAAPAQGGKSGGSLSSDIASPRPRTESSPADSPSGRIPAPPQIPGFPGDTAFSPIPPDPIMAAGRNHLVTATNSVVTIRDKQGNLVPNGTISLCGFFNRGGMPPTQLCTPTDQVQIGDPWVVYDEYVDRFWIIAISVNQIPQISRILVAISESGDPTQGWLLYSMDAGLNGMEDSGNWCDYDKMGVDAQAVYFTCNMFDFDFPNPDFQHSKVRVMTKSQFMQGAPDGLLWADFWGSELCEGGFCLGRSFTVQPAHMYGAAIDDGEFLISSDRESGSQLKVRHITHAERCCIPGMQSLPDLVSADGHEVGHFDAPPPARQPNTTTGIDTGDARLLVALWRNGHLSAVHNIACHDPADACIAFEELDVAGFPDNIITLTDGFLPGPAGSDRYYPAIAGNVGEDKTMVYSVSDGATQFAGAAFVGIPSSSTCHQCFDGPEVTLQAGQSSYINLACQTQDPRNRWGDYSGAAADPDGVGIWIFGEFATNSLGLCPDGTTMINAWGTWGGITRDETFPNPVPHIDSISPSSAVVRGPGLRLTVRGAFFISTSVVQWDGQNRPTSFVPELCDPLPPSRCLVADIPASDIETVGDRSVTVFTPRPGGGFSNGVTFTVNPILTCSKTFTNAAGNGLWQVDANWNPNGVPGPSDDACILGQFTVTLSAGTQAIHALEIESFAPFTISNGSSLSIAVSSVIGQGGVNINNGTLTPNGDLGINGSLMLDGTILNGTGNITVNRLFTWAAGTIGGSGNFNANGGITMSAGGDKSLSGGRMLNNAGMATWTAGRLGLANTATWHNLSGGTLDVQGDLSIINFGCSPGCTFQNDGTFQKSMGTGVTAIGFFGPFNNGTTGRVDVQTGTVTLQSGSGSSSGSITVAGVLTFNGNYTLAAGSSSNLSGAGTVNFMGGTVDVSGTYNITGNTNVSGGVVNFNAGSITNIGQLSISGGTGNFNSGSTITQTTFSLSGSGVLQGSDPFTITGLFTWAAGTIGGSGNFNANGGITMSTGGDRSLSGARMLNNAGMATWTAGRLGLANTATWHNL